VKLRGLKGTAEDLIRSGPEHLADDVVGTSAAVAVVVKGIGGDEPVVDGIAEDAAEEAQ
jgi:hypothetical protein